jgi:hypothetical protein
LKLYVNGVKQIDEESFANPELADTHEIVIGNSDTHSMGGTIDDVRIYDRALSEEEVRLLYESVAASTALFLQGLPLRVNDFRESVVAIAAEWDDWANAAYLKAWQYYASLKRWSFRCSEHGNTWASSQYKAMRDALEAGAAVTCTFVFDGEILVNETVYVVGVTKRYAPSYDVQKIREFEVEVREVS